MSMLSLERVAFAFPRDRRRRQHGRKAAAAASAAGGSASRRCDHAPPVRDVNVESEADIDGPQQSPAGVARPACEPARRRARSSAKSEASLDGARARRGALLKEGGEAPLSIFAELSLGLERGEMVALLGPNGAGKTTLLRLAAGLLRPTGGSVRLDGRELQTWPRRRLAQTLAYLPQDALPAFDFPAALMVELGRAPYQRMLGGLTASDRRVVAEALADTATSDLADRAFSELSGGERRRVLLAMVLAQEPRVLLLDEPTAHLDLRFQVEVLALIRRLRHVRGLTVLAAMHDLNLASLYFDRLLLLQAGHLVADGPPQGVLTAARVAATFGTEILVVPHPGSRRPQVLAAGEDGGR